MNTSRKVLSIEHLLGQNSQVVSLADLPKTFMELDHLGCVRISGLEATEFLQSQFTNDVTTLQSISQQLNAYCNPKGRAISVFRLLRDDDCFYLVLPADLALSVLKRLQLYKMRANVELVLEENITIFGTVNLSDEELDDQRRWWSFDDYRGILLVEGGQNPILDQTMDSVESESDLWRVTEVINGIPQIYQSTSEEFIPQHINLDIISAVNFSKGCYPGQEIVARLRYLGKMKQRMIAGVVPHNEQCAPGEEVFTEDRGEQKAGKVVESVGCGPLNYVLVTVPSTNIEEGDIRIGSPNGPVLERLSLPYAVSHDRC